MHLDERLHNSRETISKQLAVGQKKVSSAFNNLWAEMEAMREQRKRAEEQKAAAAGKSSDSGSDKSARFPKSPDLSNAQANLQAASTRAGAYLSSWGTWANEKKKGWGRSATSSPVTSPGPTDLKRAEEFRREKAGLGGVSSHGPRSVMSPGLISERLEGLKVEEGKEEKGKVDADVKRESLFFDAEKERGKSGAGGA